MGALERSGARIARAMPLVQRRRQCADVDRTEWLSDERFATVKGRFDHMAEIVQRIDEALAAKRRDEWGALFDDNGMIWGPALGLHEVVGDSQATALGLFPPLEHPERGVYRTVSIPMRFPCR